MNKLLIKSILSESSLSRVWQHGKNGFALLSASRRPEHILSELGYVYSSAFKSKEEIYDKENLDKDEVDLVNSENTRKSNELKSDLRNLGYGSFPVSGQYRHENGVVTTELSFFVPKPESKPFEEFEQDMVELGKEYKQESILVKEPSDGNAFLVYMEDERRDSIGKNISYNQFSEYYSQLR